MLSLLRSYTLLSTFRLRPSLLPVVTRHFLTTSPTNSPAKKASKEASSRASAGHKSNDKPSAKSETKPAVVAKKEKPRRFKKKDLKPPTKKPLSPFVAFVVEKVNERRASGTPFVFADVLRESGAAWRNFSEAEKQSYAASPDEYEAYHTAVKNWKSSLSPEAKSALKVRRRRKKGTGHSLFLSETLKDAVGNTFGEKMVDRALAWKSLSSEEKATYQTRASKTLYGVRAERAAIRDRAFGRATVAKERAAAAKRKAAERKLQEKAAKQKKREVEKVKKAKQAELKKAQIMKAKAEQKLKAKKALDKMKAKPGVTEPKPGKTTVKTTA